MSAVLELACRLIERVSVTPDDAGCQRLIAERLARCRFSSEPLRFEEVSNLWSRRGGGTPLVCFAGHTDVVPAGPEAAWRSPPFEPTVRGADLYGRGSADMKGALAAMVIATERFLERHPDHAGAIAFLLTSDEEGPAVNGTRRVVETLAARGEHIDFCLVGEPSSQQRLGDTLRNGRRGSLNGKLHLRGKQGHVAYPESACNPIHAAGALIATLTAREWDQGNAYFPPTTFQISSIKSGTGASNVIPGELEMEFNFRYSTELSADAISSQVDALVGATGLQYQLDWTHMGEPFLTPRGELVRAAETAVAEVTGQTPALSTGGGTSDGRFIAPTGAQVVELGLVNASIHQVNERTAVDDLDQLAAIYERLLELLLL